MANPIGLVCGVVFNERVGQGGVRMSAITSALSEVRLAITEPKATHRERPSSYIPWRAPRTSEVGW